MSKCQARQYSDQMHCGLCGLTWDMNDIDPPQCKPLREEEKPKQMTVSIKRQVHDEVVVEIPDEDWAQLKNALATGDWSYFNGKQNRGRP